MCEKHDDKCSLWIEAGQMSDLEEITKLYDTACDYLESSTNYPGWKKHIYPTKEDARKGIEEESLFVVRCNGRISGSMILNHEPEHGYDQCTWHTPDQYEQIYVVRTLVVHPDDRNKGIGRILMEFAKEEAKLQGMHSIRLDVYKENTPAIRLYESCGYGYVDTVDLGYSQYGLDLFELYELPIKDAVDY